MKSMISSKKKYIISFLLFFTIGILLGGFGTYKTLAVKETKVDKQEKKEEVEVKDEIIDITKNPDYKELVDRLYSYLSKDISFYNSTGLNLDNMNNDDKLRVMYNYIINNKLYENTDLEPVYYGALTCNYNFNLDIVVGDNGVLSNGTKCSVIKFSKEQLSNAYKSIFNNDTLFLVNFNPSNNKACYADDNDYYCGNINNSTGVTGSMEARFEIVKVLKGKDYIEIYDKGYLIDNRSNIKNNEDGHDNYFLHTTDSTEYYYELKSSDNVTFAHKFIIASDSNYKYNGTIVVEK